MHFFCRENALKGDYQSGGAIVIASGGESLLYSIMGVLGLFLHDFASDPHACRSIPPSNQRALHYLPYGTGMTSIPNDTSIEPHLETICSRFIEQWKSGRRPRVEEFLGATVEPVRSRLLAALLKTEL